MVPVSFTKEDIDKRNQYVAKLANLPFGITAYDLRELIEKINAKTCFIPRTRDKYSRARYAYITFESEEDFNKAVIGDDQYEIKGQPLI